MPVPACLQCRAQAIYEHVARHLIDQGAKSTRSINEGLNLSCVYRSAAGLACAAGCLLSEEEAAAADLGQGTDNPSPGWGPLIARDRSLDEPKLGRFDGSAHLIIQLQQIHDHCLVHDWPRKLAGLPNIMVGTYPHLKNLHVKAPQWLLELVD